MPIMKPKNEIFFTVWSSQMAYVLGFFIADGCVFSNSRGARYVAFYSTDRDIILQIRDLICPQHSITVRPIKKRMRQTSFTLQIGSKKMVTHLASLGIGSNKSKRVAFPQVPRSFLSHFVRGYFDGDGSIFVGYCARFGRSLKALVVLSRFTSGSKKFLEVLQRQLFNIIQSRGSLSLS